MSNPYEEARVGTENVMLLSVPNEVAKFMDPSMLRLILIDHFFKNKSIETIAAVYGLPMIDVKFFLASAEAMTLLKTIKEDVDPEQLKNRSIEELREDLISKLKQILATASNRDVVDAVDRISPRILELERLLLERDNLISKATKSSLFDLTKNTEFTVVEDEDYRVDLDTEMPVFKRIDDIHDES